MLRKYGSKLKIAASSLSLEEVVSETTPASNYKKIENKSNEFLYFRARAISAGDQGPTRGEPNPNGNGDYFPRAELETSYETFSGRNLFLNHDSDHPIKSIGKILDAYAVEDPETGEYYVECLAKIDKKLHPEMARKVETGELNTVSMGCSCEASRCSVCGQSVYTDDDVKCEHIEPSGILKTYTALVDIPEYGIKKGVEVTAFSINTGLVFNELSIVNVPADEDAYIKTVIASNLRVKITKKAKLDDTETQHLQTLLNALDEDSKKVIKAKFCACPVPEEEKSMSDKKISKDPKRDPNIDGILKKLDGLEYLEFANWLENKMEKESNKVVKVEKSVEKSDSKVSSAVDKVKNSFIGKLFNRAVKEELGDPKKKDKKVVKASPIEVTAKFVKAEKFEDSYWILSKGTRQILKANVSKLWDKKQIAQKKYQDWTSSEDYGKKLVLTYKKLGFLKTAKLLGLGFKTVDIKDTKVKMPAKKDFVKAEEKSKADKEHTKSEKSVERANEEPVGEKMIEDEKKETGSKKKKEAGHKPDCGCGFCKKVFKKDKKDDNKKPDADKDGVPDWADKKPGEDDKKASSDKCPECGKDKPKDKVMCSHCFDKNIDKKNKDASVNKCKKCMEVECKCGKDHKKKADEMESVEDMSPVVEEVEEDKAIVEDAPIEDAPMNDDGIDLEHQSAFDKLDDKLIISEGLEAIKDKETNEIVITDATGTEVKRIADGFGDDVPSVLKLLQDIMGVVPEGEEGEVTPMPEKSVETPETETGAPAEEEVEEEVVDPFVASKKSKVVKKATEDQSKLFAEAATKRMAKCTEIVEVMVEKEMISFSEEDVEIELKKKATLLDARETAMKKAISEQVKLLIGMDDISLKNFKASIDKFTIKKEAKSNKLTSPIHLGYKPSDMDSEIGSIFNSMGNG